MDIILISFFSYLSGSIPFGLILTKIFGKIDVRNIGSGNIGATNVLRTGNKFLAIMTLLLDIAKGYIPVMFTIIYFPAAVLIGRWHTQTQLSTEKVLWGFEEPMVAKMVRILLDVQTGKASKEQIQEFDKFFTDIEKKDIGEF